LKHEYTADELAELKSIYDESGEAGLSRDEMRALRKVGLVKQDLPPEPEKPHEDTLAGYQALSAPEEPEKPKLKATSANRHPEIRQAVYDTIASFCDSGHVPTIQKIADAMHMSKSTVANHVLALAKEGRISKDPKTGRYRIANQTIEQKEPIMATTVQEQKQEAKPEEPRIIIANALVGIFDAVSALQRTAFQANDKVVYGFATKLLTGELMDIKANYSKDVAK
jgi:DNA-binding MarR family transcriptional regulator